MTDGYDAQDPYRYGRPDPTPQPHGGAPRPYAGPPRGKEILAASWRLLRQDKELIALPALGFAAALVAFAILFVPGFFIGKAAGAGTEAAVYIGAVLGVFVASAVSMFFQAALVAGASQRADGLDPTLGSALAAAATRWRLILGWAVLATTVGTVIRAIEQRLGILGAVLGFLGGVAWSVASFFVVPVLIIDGLGPVEALKRSSSVIRDTWGTSVRTSLRLGVVGLIVVVPLALLFAGVATIGNGSVAGGIVLAVVGIVGLFALVLVLGAVNTYARTLIYRYATGRPVPIDADLLAGAFRPKGRRGRRQRY